MPVYNFGFSRETHSPNPAALADFGPVLPVQVLVPKALGETRAAQRRPTALLVSGVALIDTGAGKSCIDNQAVTALHLNQIGSVALGTAGGRVSAALFPARFVIAP